MKRNLAPTCTYVHSVPREKHSQVSKPGIGSKDVQTQIRNLEEMVITLMNQTSKNKPSSSTGSNVLSTSESSLEFSVSDLNDSSGSNDQAGLAGSVLRDTAESFGRISIDDNQLNYVGSTHWAAILDNVCPFFSINLHV